MALAILTLALTALTIDSTGFFGAIFALLVIITVIPLGAVILLVSGVLGSAEMAQARKAKKSALPAAMPDNDEEAVDGRASIHE